MDVNLDGNTITNAYLSDIVVTGAADMAGSQLTLPPDSVDISNINATGTPSSTSYLRGDGTWTNPTSGGIAVTLTGDAVGTGTGTVPVTVERLNGTSLAALATGLLKNTTATGVPSIAAAGTDYLSPAAIGTTIQPYNANTTTAGNTFNGASELLQADGSGYILDSAIRPGGKLIYVSQAQGNDTRTGLSKYSYQHPFATYTAAISAAASGDTIVMTDGTFTSKNNLLVGGVSIVLLPEANFLVTGTTNADAIFTDNGTAATNVTIAGYGQTLVMMGNTNSILNGLLLTAASSVTINNLNASATNSSSSGVANTIYNNSTGTVQWVGTTLIATGEPLGNSNAIYNANSGSVIFSGEAISTSQAAISNSSTGKVSVGTLLDSTFYSAFSTGTGLTIISPQTIVQSFAPSTGFSQAFSHGPQDQNMVITPSSTLATGTVTFPADANTRIGQKMWISNASAYTITSLAVSVSGGTIYGYSTGPLPPGSIMFQKTAANVWQQISPSNGAVSGVSSITNSDGTLSISPTTGAAVASVASPDILTLASPSTGSTQAFNSNSHNQILYVTGITSIASLTITLPPDSFTKVGQQLTVCFQQASSSYINTLTFTVSGGTIWGVSPALEIGPSTYSFQKISANLWQCTLNPSFIFSLGGTLQFNAYIQCPASFIAGANYGFAWNGRSSLASPSNGVISATNYANTGFTRLTLGPDTSSFPALAPNGTTMDVVLGGGTTLTALNAAALIVGSGTSAVTLSSGASSAQTLTLPNATGTVALTDSGNITTVTGTSQTATANHIYITNNASLVTVTLPSAANVGDTVEINGLGAGGWSLAQNASQVMHMSSASTTTGTGGSIASTNQYNILKVRCIVASTTWIAIESQGTLTVT